MIGDFVEFAGGDALLEDVDQQGDVDGDVQRWEEMEPVQRLMLDAQRRSVETHRQEAEHLLRVETQRAHVRVQQFAAFIPSQTLIMITAILLFTWNLE